MGIVLVLLPGGPFLMGAASEPGSRNHDRRAKPDEKPVHEVRLDPFFMGKYEVTQAQWERLAGRNPSYWKAGRNNHVGGTFTLSNPVTNVNWHDCMAMAKRAGLHLPTEAQWEYGCRADTGSVYWCGDTVQSIQEKQAGNLADRTCRRKGGDWEYTEQVEDGHMFHAPIGSYAANGFGLHDVHGNVWEWCQDGYDPGAYSKNPRGGDGRRGRIRIVRSHIQRGGCFYSMPQYLRSALRNRGDPISRDADLGVRFARHVDQTP